MYVLCLENSVKGGLILRAQLAEGLQISTEDKTGGTSASYEVSSLCF